MLSYHARRVRAPRIRIRKGFVVDFMSSAQVINHRRDKNPEYEEMSKNISDRCINILRILNTNLVNDKVNMFLNNLDNLGNSMNNSSKYDLQQKKFIREKILEIAK